MAIQLSDQVCSLIQAKRLKELGVNQESYFVHKINEIQDVVSTSQFKKWCEEYLPTCNDYYSAFSVAELGIALPPNGRTIFKVHDGWEFTIGTSDWKDWRRYSTEAQARAELLIYLIENKIVSVEEINERLKG